LLIVISKATHISVNDWGTWTWTPGNLALWDSATLLGLGIEIGIGRVGTREVCRLWSSWVPEDWETGRSVCVTERTLNDEWPQQNAEWIGITRCEARTAIIRSWDQDEDEDDDSRELRLGW